MMLLSRPVPLVYFFRPFSPRLLLPHPLHPAPNRTNWFGSLATPSAVALDQPVVVLPTRTKNAAERQHQHQLAGNEHTTLAEWENVLLPGRMYACIGILAPEGVPGGMDDTYTHPSRLEIASNECNGAELHPARQASLLLPSANTAVYSSRVHDIPPATCFIAMVTLSAVRKTRHYRAFPPLGLCDKLRTPSSPCCLLRSHRSHYTRLRRRNLLTGQQTTEPTHRTATAIYMG